MRLPDQPDAISCCAQPATSNMALDNRSGAAAGRAEKRQGTGPTNGRRYFGLTDGSPPGVPGGRTTGMGSPDGGGGRLIWGSTSAGGAITPPDRLKSELVAPLDGGTVG